MSHTPGPWIAVGSWVEHGYDEVADICNCDPESMGQGHLARSERERMANAKLIAAAPDMLLALQEILIDADLAGEKTSVAEIDAHLERIRNIARNITSWFESKS